MALRDMNLIPGEILERRSLVRHLLLWAGCLAAVAVLFWAVNGYQSRRLSGEAQNRPGAGKDRAALARLVADIRKEQDQLNLSLREQAQLSAWIEQGRPYASVLAKLSEVMNRETWLQQLASHTGQDRARLLALTGFSHSHETLGVFIQRLSGEPLFSRVVLKSAQEKKNPIAGSAPVQFQVECEIAKGAP